MHEEYDSTITKTKGDTFYKVLLSFYPSSYRMRFGQEMLYAFRDLYEEEIMENRKAGIGFWFSVIKDTLLSVVIEHIDMLKKQGLKNYLHISNYNIIGFILLLPFLALFGIDFLGRLAQGDFTHYNRVWYSVVSHMLLYNTYSGQAPLLFTILILAPFLAVLINLIPVISFIKRRKKITLKAVLLAYPLAAILICFGLFSLLIVWGHDFVPCVVNGLLKTGFSQLFQILSVCRNA